MFPEAHTFAFDVLSCAIVSSLVHRTVVPTAMVRGLGLNALDPSVRAFIGIETGVLPVAGAGVGVGVVPATERNNRRRTRPEEWKRS